ncbi:hypothetical protein phiTE_226 [Pectobacterium phage phiTE]|uniref:Uncharacterized protein n=1 Tax=Pectobacterium phage phiTE TaxID=1116482 RepID=K9L5Q9_9CAUD|nr:hypothetical protein phiTE_226 [Pectobacterium phage phiTE]AEZ66392.1 hypothetical protein phiTE_226 [Pectobacterium phage phiTE]
MVAHAEKETEMITFILMTLIFIACVEAERKNGPMVVPDHPEGFDPWRG